MKNFLEKLCLEVANNEPQPYPSPHLQSCNIVLGPLCVSAGGLGDVMQALPKAMAARGHRVMCIAPRYKNYDVSNSFFYIVLLSAIVGGWEGWAGLSCEASSSDGGDISWAESAAARVGAGLYWQGHIGSHL